MFFYALSAAISDRGVAERFKAAVSKTAGGNTRGFESLHAPTFPKMTVLGRVEGVELGEIALFVKPKDVAPKVIFGKVRPGGQRDGVLCHGVVERISKEKRGDATIYGDIPSKFRRSC